MEPVNGLMAGLSDRGHDLSVDYSFDIEFLVAKERPDSAYALNDDNHSDISDSDLSHLRWVCPADEQDPLGAILDRCKILLVQNNEPVAICYDNANASLRVFTAETTEEVEIAGSDPVPGRTAYWRLEPCSTARVKKGGPPEFDWFGIRLRSPTYPESELADPDSNVKWAIAALRMGLTMHVNSTCRFNVRVQPSLFSPGDAPMTLLAAKKLTTLVWVMERDLLLRVCPGSQASSQGSSSGSSGSGSNHGVHWRHVKPLDSFSRIASARWKGHVENTRPQDPLRAGIMDQHLPPLHDKVIQERLHDVWAAATLRELSNGLCCNDGSPASFAIHVPDSTSTYESDLDSATTDTDNNYPVYPTAELRYALWHPYSALDASTHWIQLAISLLKATAPPSFEFKEHVRSIDRTVRGFGRGVAPSARWKILLDRLRLSEDWAAPWERIVEEYRDGRRLGYPAIDRYPVLDQIDELKEFKR